jgi:hypothetical protein
VSELTVTGSRALLLDSNTVVPAAGAGAVSVTVQVVVMPDVTLLGLQVSWETESGCPCAMPENEKITAAAIARLLDGFDFRIVLTGHWLPETRVDFVSRILGHDDAAPAKSHVHNNSPQSNSGPADPVPEFCGIDSNSSGWRMRESSVLPSPTRTLRSFTTLISALRCPDASLVLKLKGELKFTLVLRM